MHLTHDREADAVYVEFTDRPVGYSKELDERRIVDYDGTGRVRGVELLYVTDGVDVAGLPEELALASVLEQHNIRVLRHSRQ